MSSKQTEVVVIGAGPGGYTAAFRAADLGKKVTLVEYYPKLGGVCLNVGCIPSKALLNIAGKIDEFAKLQAMGISAENVSYDLTKVRSWKEKVVTKLTAGLSGLAKQRKVEVVQGRAEFTSPESIYVDGADVNIQFQNCIIAAGSSVVKLPFLPEDPRIIDSTGALALQDVPKSMLVIGGGIIGMEMGTVYAALGSEITVVELTPSIFPGVDPDLVQVVQKIMAKKFKNIMVNTKVVAVDAKSDGIWVTFEGAKAPSAPQRFDKVLSAVGRAPNGKLLALDKAKVKVDERGFIPVDSQQRTNVPHIFAIGDIVGQPMLAHKAIPEGKVAAEVICGKNYHFTPKCIPNVAYTNPEVAWVGITEAEAKVQGIAYDVGKFPWMACGRAIAMGHEEGFSKVIVDKKTQKLIGAGIVGMHAGDLIAEAALAIEMGCDIEDIALTVHPHPTLTETLCQAAEAYTGAITDLYMPKK